MNIIDRFRLTDKKAIVTGAGGGIGKGFAIALAEAGADIAVVDINEKSAEEVSKIIKIMGRDSIAVKADVSNPEDIKNMISIIMDKWSRLDIAVNNAGISIRGYAETFPLESWDKVMNLDLRGNFLCAQEEGKIMINQKYGKIIFTSSMCGNIINKPQFQISMSVAKAGEQHLTRCLAAEWAKYGIRVNCISPGYILTPALEAPDLKPQLDYWTELTPIGRLGKIEDLQGAVLYLASDVSDFMTGQNLIIDGGYVLF